jgi:hypothetical protein
MLKLSTNDLEQLRAALAASGEDFALLSGLPDTIAHVRFIGRFENREVVWDMQLMTLARYEQEHGRLADEALRGLMHIAPVTDGIYRLEVALDVPLIDAPSVKKTIVMMRNYRQLHLGLRTWKNQSGSASI